MVVGHEDFVVDNTSGIFPRHSNGAMERESNGTVEPLPLAIGRSILLAPEDPLTRVSIASEGAPLMLLPGRTKAQNGWFEHKIEKTDVCHKKIVDTVS
jgi:endoglucanase